MTASPKLVPVAEPPPHPGSMEALALLRAPFPDNLVSKLPKETKKQAEERKAGQDKGVWPAKCTVCAGFHHPKAVHLDYVGHAALTTRLLDVDPMWSWEPLAVTEHGLPAFDQSGGLWIRLTVCGVTRLGYGHAAAKPNMDPGSREKEVIGDALRNAAMRFGAALDLWHKGDLHAHEEADSEPVASAADTAIAMLRGAGNAEWFKDAWEKNKAGWKEVMSAPDYARVVAVMKDEAAKHAPPKAAPAADVLDGDDIPAEFK